MYLVKTPIFIQKIYESCTWRIDSKDSIYLTFDDGPHPEATPLVLELLKTYDAKATFFCIGENARAHPKLVQQILVSGHTIGNHSYSHPSGWTTKTKNYIADVDKCKEIIDSKLFRPPYGRLKPSQLNELVAKYKVIMWDIMCGDFEDQLTKEICLSNITDNAKAGSIILLHDTASSIKKLKYVLPKVLEFYNTKGLKFKAIPE